MGFACTRKPVPNSLQAREDDARDRGARGAEGDELRELAETFRSTVHRLSTLVGELEAAHEHAVRAERRFRDLVHSLDAIVWEADVADGRFTFVSQRAVDLLGYPVDEWLREPGFWAEHLHPEDRADAVAQWNAAVTSGRNHQLEYRMIAQGGRVIWIQNLIHVVENQDGRPISMRGLMVDVTERRRSQEALQKSESSLARAQQIAHLGSWDYDARRDLLFWSDEAYRILGQERQDFYGSCAAFLETVHPDDRELVREAFERALETGQPYSIEHRIIPSGGAARCIRFQAEAIPGPDGRPARLTGTIQDVTERRQIERELEAAHAQALQAEVDKKRFYRDVICAVTQGKFELVDREQIPEEGELLADLPVVTGDDYAAARDAIAEFARQAGMNEDQSIDLVLAAGEAITNSMKHAREGRCRIYRTAEAIILRITDQGSGISSEDLPAAILMPGFSTKVSLGMGYTMMLKLADRVWLSTDCDGTVIQLQKLIKPHDEEANLLEEVLKRM